MIILLTGDNKPLFSNFIKGRKQGYSSVNIIEFSGRDFSVSDVQDTLLTTGMFEDKKLVIVRPNGIHQIDISEMSLKETSESSSIELIIDVSDVRSTTKVFKKLKKFSKVQKFVLPRDYTNFNISDAFFIHADKKRILYQIDQVNEIETNFHGVIWAFHSGLRNYLSMVNRNETWNSLHPFVKKKVSQTSSIDVEKAKKLYKKLFDLDVSLKSTNTSRKGLIQDFVIYL